MRKANNVIQAQLVTANSEKGAIVNEFEFGSKLNRGLGVRLLEAM